MAVTHRSRDPPTHHCLVRLLGDSSKHQFGGEIGEVDSLFGCKSCESVHSLSSHQSHPFAVLSSRPLMDWINSYTVLLHTLIRRPTVRPTGDFSYMAPHNEVLPKTVDWRKHGYVTKVKNQKQCGSCWAFSATGALEGQHKRKTGKLVSLSEQNLVDCDKNSYGCYGGWSENAFTYVKNNRGIDTEKSYPYEAKDGKCRFKRKTVGASCTGFVDLPQDEKSLQKAVATVGPISVSIDARHNSFYNYRSGVYYEPDCDPNDLDHSVLVVGYGTTKKGRKYWLVKNSWARDWGLKGYIKMSRDRGNNCGIASDACYPTV